jgi:hypothetical protein
MDSDYSVFVHLADPAEQIWAQHDSQPVQGGFPTSSWLPGEIVVDQHPIELDAEVPAGRYRLMTGMYDSSTGRRLTIKGGSAIVLDQDRILLADLEVGPPGDLESAPRQ